MQKRSEEWRDIPGYEGYYQVSSFGRIRSLDRFVPMMSYRRGRMVKGGIKSAAMDKHGYLKVLLCQHGMRKNRFVHQLVALAFIPNPKNLLTVNHKDETKTNNHVSNLEWMSSENNLRYSKSKRVRQLDMNGNLIKEWESMSAAERAMGYSTSIISNRCKHKTKSSIAYGFKWEYA